MIFIIKYVVDNQEFNRNNISQFRYFFNNNFTNIEIFLIYNIILDDFIKNEFVNLVNNKIRFIEL